MISATNSTSKYFCHVCQINLNCEANFALHEFNDKHCENLLKLSKNKQVKPKAAKPPEQIPNPLAPPPPPPIADEEPPKVNPSLYGYFNAETFAPVNKEFNTEYDPYLQKLADNPWKPPVIATDFNTGKKKKKRYCEICEVTLSTIPAFQAHMTSPGHIYKLKMLGMGVSAHFVKASTDLHTTDLFAQGEKPTEGSDANGQTLFQCDVCDLTLNSQSQYDAHLAGKAHNEKAKKREKKKAAMSILTCYTCNVQLAGIIVFNDHKNGRKHRNKCMSLIRNGYTIPPEERPLDMANRRFPEPPLYPELYMKEVVAKQENKQEVNAEPVAAPEAEVPSTAEELMPPPPPPPPKPDINMSTGLYHCAECGNKFTTSSKLQLHLLSVHPSPHAVTHGEDAEDLPPGTVEVDLPPPEVYLECTICHLTFKEPSVFHVHLDSEDHAVKVWEAVMSGVPLNVIIDELQSNWNVIKPCNGKYYCWTCNVLSNNQGENKLHLESEVHKVAEKMQIKNWRTVLQESVPREEDGTFHCKLCVSTWPTLVEFNKHVLSTTHTGLLNKDKKRRIIMNAMRFQTEKNPGFRTKIPGLATDLGTGATERVPNLEPLEPKIDQDKNVNLGITLPAWEAKRGRMRPPARRPRPRFTPYPPPRNYGPPPRQWLPGQFAPPQFDQRMRFPPRNRFPGRPPRPGSWGRYPC